MTKVFNLATGEVLYFMLPPYEAVRNAYLLYSARDKNTWDYVKRDVEIRCGRYCVSCGDFTAISCLKA